MTAPAPWVTARKAEFDERLSALVGEFADVLLGGPCSCGLESCDSACDGAELAGEAARTGTARPTEWALAVGWDDIASGDSWTSLERPARMKRTHLLGLLAAARESA